MSAIYLEKPVLTKKTKVIEETDFTASTCEMQGIFMDIQDGEKTWKMLS